jgi:hypothetical protein
MSSTTTMPYGKHQGKPISSIPIGYLLWASENFKPGELRETIDRELLSRGGAPAKKQKTRNLSAYCDKASHYSWTDFTGRVHRIPNDVDMSGRENEPCPFELTPEPEFESLTELDREFRSIVA